jgi:hypothetical protein
MEWTVTPETDPSPDGYFWSHQVAIVGGSAAYAGLQTMGAEPAGKIAIFSVWEALGAEGPVYAAPFGGEGEGWSVRIPFAWEVAGTYRFVLGATDSGSGWSCTVDSQLIGTIAVDPRWRGLDSTSIMWTERYAGPMRSCADIAHASVVFGEPAAEDGVVRPLTHRNHLGQPVGCPGSSVEDVDGRAVRHVMGARLDRVLDPLL